MRLQAADEARRQAGVNPAKNPALRDDPPQPVPVEQRDQLPINPQTKKLDKSCFVWDAENRCYYCPEAKQL